MNPRHVAAVAIALLLALLVWRLLPASHAASDVIANPDTSRAAIDAKSSATDHKLATEIVTTANGESHLADSLNAPGGNIRSDLEIVNQVLEAFRTNFLAAGNPVGDNTEITAALTGHNKLHTAFIPPRHVAINSRGELCDRWGTPFFFHQNSGTQMEIRSAGPDRKLWSTDDVVLTP